MSIDEHFQKARGLEFNDFKLPIAGSNLMYRLKLFLDLSPLVAQIKTGPRKYKIICF